MCVFLLGIEDEQVLQRIVADKLVKVLSIAINDAGRAGPHHEKPDNLIRSTLLIRVTSTGMVPRRSPKIDGARGTPCRACDTQLTCHRPSHDSQNSRRLCETVPSGFNAGLNPRRSHVHGDSHIDDTQEMAVAAGFPPVAAVAYVSWAYPPSDLKRVDVARIGNRGAKRTMPANKGHITSGRKNRVLSGEGISPGLAIGKAWLYDGTVNRKPRSPGIDRSEIQRQHTRIKRAVEQVLEELEESADQVEREMNDDLAAIFRAHQRILTSPELLTELQNRLTAELVDAEEMGRVRTLAQQAAGAMGISELPPLGAMIETPAAALCVDDIAVHADFLSLGTNDLTQYTMAADRENPTASHYFQDAHRAVFKLVETVCQQSKEKPLSICGELAGRPSAIPTLLNLGIRTLSVAPPLIPIVKETVRNQVL